MNRLCYTVRYNPKCILSWKAGCAQTLRATQTHTQTRPQTRKQPHQTHRRSATSWSRGGRWPGATLCTNPRANYERYHRRPILRHEPQAIRKKQRKRGTQRETKPKINNK